MKKVVSFIIFIAVIYGIYVGIEVYRFRKDTSMQPLIVLDQKTKDNKNIYEGLGINVEYTITDGDITGGEIFLFDKRLSVWVS